MLFAFTGSDFSNLIAAMLAVILLTALLCAAFVHFRDYIIDRQNSNKLSPQPNDLGDLAADSKKVVPVRDKLSL